MGVSTSISGPLPPPSLLKGYEDACPGAARQLLKMAEEQALHRRNLENQAANAAIEDLRRDYGEALLGQLCGLVIALTMVGAGIVVVFHGYPWPGAMLGSGGLGLPLVSAFLRGRQHYESSQKVTSLPSTGTAKGNSDRGKSS